ncbi:MAG TPA: hypothetical protein PLZ93_04500 [Nocardioides sp.]|uniref:hypothetical protein n=1 Tax=uncultured Nocardioides sp. TaxID=198441 RepID=UPI000EC7EE48|nr:hypothetical protein [uncultured Nocardioides sp.]HCB04156.1 hypothetical protein [Nocardioides sp.]HRD60363.1 hypothetical protein [Nocardioides sp.]HRI94849.1 hypothetical protein [Nocardioides sp.]HRK44912.1 hypothetical protein [Nocardioides sp.]
MPVTQSSSNLLYAAAGCLAVAASIGGCNVGSDTATAVNSAPTTTIHHTVPADSGQVSTAPTLQTVVLELGL